MTGTAETLRNLRTLADLAAKTHRDLFQSQPQRMVEDMRKALLENSLEIQRRYAIDALRKDRGGRTRAANMKGFQGLLNDVALILHTAEAKHRGRYTKAMYDDVQRNLAMSRDHHFARRKAGA